MFNLVLHTALLILAAFILGAILGSLFKRFYSSGPSYGSGTRATPAATGAAAAAATVAAKTAAPEPVSVKAVDSEPKAVEPKATKPKADEPKAPEPEAAEPKAAEPKVSKPKAAEPKAPDPEPVKEEAAPSGRGGDEEVEASRPMGLDGPRDGKKDNLQRIKGVGKVIEGKLNGLGIWHFDQIASWGDDEVAWVNSHLSFSGRIQREEWIKQAKALASGEETEFSKRVDKGEVATSKKK